jgi:carboxypeptidase D
MKSYSMLLLLAALLCMVAANGPTEYVAMVSVPNPEDVVTLIKRGISLDHPNKKAQTFEAYVTEQERAILDEMNLEYTIEPQEHLLEKRASNGVDYHDYTKLTNFMSAIAAQYPGITRLFSIGKSVQNRELWGMQISDNIEADEAEPEFKYIANMHGDEVVGREMSIYLIEYLCSQYGINERVTRLVNETDIYIIPTMNPDGFERRTRGNQNGVDLNRNFPDQFSSPENTKTGRQVEVVAVMDFVEEHNFVLSANFHGGAVVANYPYDGNSDYRSGAYTPSPDDEVFKILATTYSQKHRSMHNSREFSGGITNGADWYVLYGGMQDWNYVYNQGVFEITVELSDNKWPSASTLAGHWDDNREAMLSYMELVHSLGVRGIVTDSNGAPLAATITVEGNTRTIKSNPSHGDYYRLLTPGTYTVTASAVGFGSVSQVVTISDDQVMQQVLNFVLTAQ